jgi:DNA-binding CsgD family transcriptional regulator
LSHLTFQQDVPFARVQAALNLPTLLSEWLSRDQYARLICDSEATVLWHNRRFSELVQSSRTIRLERSSLQFASLRDQNSLSYFLRGQSEERAIFALSDDERSVPWIVQCQRISNAPMVTGIRIVQPDSDPAVDFEGFSKYFELTPNETKICRQLLGGMNVENIIRVSQKSPDTVRFHIRNIYRKINVSSREEFFACLYRFKFS